MSKTPYEIRLDVLELAQRILQNKQEKDIKEYESSIDNIYRMSERFTKQEMNNIIHNKPLSYTTDDVINQANILYQFISNNSTSTK
jgi:hypothetical protein